MLSIDMYAGASKCNVPENLTIVTGSDHAVIPARLPVSYQFSAYAFTHGTVIIAIAIVVFIVIAHNTKNSGSTIFSFKQTSYVKFTLEAYRFTGSKEWNKTYNVYTSKYVAYVSQ